MAAILLTSKLEPVYSQSEKSADILQLRSRAHNFDVPYIIYSKFSKSRARNLQW